MRREKTGSFLIAASLSAVIAYGSLTGLITGFEMELDVGQRGLFLFCLLCGVLCAGLWSFQHGGWALLCIGLLAVLRFLPDIQYGTAILMYRLTSIYNLAYDWDILEWSEEPLRNMPPDGAILTMAAGIVFAVCWVICRRHRSVWALVPAIVPILACIMVTDTVPSERAMFWLICGMILLMLTQTVRRRNGAQANRLTLIFLIPCLLMGTLLFWATPRESYEVSGNPLQNLILQWLQDLPFAPEQNGTDNPGEWESQKVDLTKVGKQTGDGQLVMEVKGAKSGILYLRGQSYDVYTGKTWQISDRTIKDLGWPEGDGAYLGDVQITTKKVHDLLYLPYYVSGGILRENLRNGRLENTTQEKSYAFWQYESREGSCELNPKMQEQCLALPDSTQAEAQKVLSQIIGDPSLSSEKQAEAIGNYVRGLVPYSLDTEMMPEKAEDFAIWFLEEAQTGYCTHYATAATVLLRAAGIPARYVSGYVIHATAGSATAVTGDMAHAWVEYYIPNVGWQVLEATPGYGTAPIPETTPTVPTTTTPGTTTNHVTVPTTPSGTQPQPSDPYLPTPTVGPEWPTVPSSEPTNPSHQTEPTKGTKVPDTTASQGTKPQPTTQQFTSFLGTGIEKAPDPASPILLWLLLIPAGLGVAVLVVLLQFILRCCIRRRRMHKGTGRRRALTRWNYVQRLCRVLKTQPPEALLALAEKAAFSQYALQEGELRVFDQWIHTAEEQVRQKPYGLLIRLFRAIS